jgi:hypothetical protein
MLATKQETNLIFNLLTHHKTFKLLENYIKESILFLFMTQGVSPQIASAQIWGRILDLLSENVLILGSHYYDSLTKIL